MKSLVWFRNDLRIADHPALHAAWEAGQVEAVFLIADRQWRAHDVGNNRIAFLLDTLHALARDLKRIGVPLHIRHAPWFDDAPRALIALARERGASSIAFNEEYPLNERVRDSRVVNACAESRLEVRMHPGSTIVPPGQLLTGAGAPYTVFTPFKRRWLSMVDPASVVPLPPPHARNHAASVMPELPEAIDGVRRTDGVQSLWPGGARQAEQRLGRFVEQAIRTYDQARDLPSRPGTSGLSPYLSVGAISPRQCLHAAVTANQGRLSGGQPGIDSWINELAWRDFYRHVIALFPHVSRGQAFRPEMDRVPWRNAPGELRAWQSGRTGYPLVDAAMRQLVTTGWMHNRLRMLTAMFLTKHLLIDWRAGERYFMQHLVDGDFAANNGGWQWSASTGTDAAPYFRIFNPITQARRFDPDGTFVRLQVAELANVPGKAIFEPRKFGVTAYPPPIVDHAFARQRALETFKAVR